MHGANSCPPDLFPDCPICRKPQNIVEAAAGVATLAENGVPFREDGAITFTVRPVDCPPDAYLGLAMAQANARARGDRRETRRLGLLLKQIERAWKERGDKK